jgi:CHASE3 domain sensor protein
MIDWNTLLVKLVDGPGAGFTMIVLGLIVVPFVSYWVRRLHREDQAFERGKQARRNDEIEMLRAQVAKMIDLQRGLPAE